MPCSIIVEYSFTKRKMRVRVSLGLRKGGGEVSRQSHKLEEVGSIPTPCTSSLIIYKPLWYSWCVRSVEGGKDSVRFREEAQVCLPTSKVADCKPVYMGATPIHTSKGVYSCRVG